MSIHDNLIYKAFIEVLNGDKELSLISFSKDPREVRFVEFYTPEGDLINRTEIDLGHNDFMELYREFARFHHRMKKAKMEDK